MKITKIVFLANRNSPASIKDVSYMVNQLNNIIAIEIAKRAFLSDKHKPEYYKSVLVTEESIL